MKKKLLAFFTILLISLSCTKEEALPVEEDKLVEVIRDIHIAEAAIQNLIGVTKDSVGEIYYDQIFEMHDVRKADFDSAMSILRTEPERFGLIYDEVLSDMERLNDTLFQY